jgi:hypothetical protein
LISTHSSLFISFRESIHSNINSSVFSKSGIFSSTTSFISTNSQVLFKLQVKYFFKLFSSKSSLTVQLKYFSISNSFKSSSSSHILLISTHSTPFLPLGERAGDWGLFAQSITNSVISFFSSSSHILFISIQPSIPLPLGEVR